MVQAIAIYKFDAAEANELSILKNEILEVVEKNDDWWTVRNKYGQAGLVPVAYIAAPIPDSDTVIVARGKTTNAHEARRENELTVKKGQQVAIFDKTDDYWWFVGLMGETGYIPKKIIQELKSSHKTQKTQKTDKVKDNVALQKFGFELVSPSEALCDDRTTILFSFQKPLPKGQFKVIFKGEHCEKVDEGERMNDFTLKTKTPKYYPAEKTVITINHQAEGQPEQVVAKNVDFLFHSKLDVVHKILSNESDPLNFLCSSFQVGDLQNVDLILSGNLEKKVPEGVELLKSSKSVLVHEQVLPKETPTLLHFAAYYDLKKLAKALLKCPGAKEALSIKNCHGNGPVGVANMRKNENMEQLLQYHKANENIDVGDEDEYMCMERCYESYIEMGGSSPQYVVPDSRKRPQSTVDDEELYEDMDGAKSGQELYDIPRPEGEDRFEGYDEELDANDNEVQKAKEDEIQKKIDEYKVFGRMTEKEVQLALLMKRVKERYITQEQALEMARVLRLEPQTPGKPPVSKRKPPKVKKRGSDVSDFERKRKSLLRTMSTSSLSSVSSVGSTDSGYASDAIKRFSPAAKSDGVNRPVPAGKPGFAGRPFSYAGLIPPTTSRKPVSPPPTSPRKPPVRTPSDPTPPAPSRRGPRSSTKVPESSKSGACGEYESDYDASPEESQQEKSKDVDLPPESHEEKSKDVDLRPESHEEKSKDVDLPPESHEEESKDVDLPPETQQEKSKDVDLPPESHEEESKDVDLPPETQQEKSKDVDLPPESHEEKSKDVDLPPESHEEKSKDVDLPPESHEEKSKPPVRTPANHGFFHPRFRPRSWTKMSQSRHVDYVDLPPELHEEESKDVDLPTESHEEKSKDVDLPPESHEEKSKDVDLRPESHEEKSKDVDLPPESHEEESKDVDLPPETQQEKSKDVDLPPESHEEKSKDVDLPPESHEEKSKPPVRTPANHGFFHPRLRPRSWTKMSQSRHVDYVDLPPELHEEESKVVDLPTESHEEKSKDVDLPPESHEEKSKDVDLRPESHEEKSKDVDLPPESHEEKSKDVDLPPESHEAKSKDVDLPAESEEEESKDVDSPPESHEEKSKDVDLPPQSHEEESKDVDLPAESQERKSKDVDLPPESHEDESKDVDLPLESQEEKSKDVDFTPESQEEKSKDVDFTPESQEEKSKDVDFTPESQEEKSKDVDFTPESQKEESEDKFKDNGSEGIRQTSYNSIIITQEGGCFSLPEASAVLLFPSQAVKKQVTLTWSEVNCKECGIKPREGELFVSGILEIEPKEVKFEKPVTVLLSHSVHEDNVFRDFYELIVKDISHTKSQELKTEHISSSKDIREELFNPNMLNDYLPAAKATISETCTLVVATRIKLHHISIAPNENFTFSERFGENAELKITFSAGVTDEIQSLQVQLFPADAVLKKDVHLDKNLVCAPVIKVTGQTTPFLEAVDVELTYSNNNIADIEDNFLPVGNRSIFTDDYGLMLRSQKSKSEYEILNGSNMYIERPRNDQLKFLFSVKHFCKLCAMVKKNAGHHWNANNSVFNSSPLLNIVFDAVVLAIHNSQKSTLYTILAPSSKRAVLKSKWMIDPSGIGPKLKVGELVYFCVPLEKIEEQEDDHMRLAADKFTFNETTIQSLLNQTKNSDCQKWSFIYFLHKRCSGNNHVFERDGFHNVEICSSKKEHNKPTIETSLAISETPAGNYDLFTEDDTRNDTFQNEFKTDPCQCFEEAVKEKFLEALGVNKDTIKNPKDGKIVEVIQDTGTITSVVIGVGLGTTIFLNIPTLGIPAIVGAAALLTTFSVTKVSGYYKKKKAKNLDCRIEMILDFELKGIIIHVAKELSRIFEYQIREMKNLTEIKTLADCAVKLMLDLNNGDKFNVNTLTRKVLKDGKAKSKDLLTRNNVKWSSPDVFRKCGLLVTNVEAERTQFIYKVKPGCERDTAKYGYRGEFLEWKEFGHEKKRHEEASEDKAAKNENETHTREQSSKYCPNDEECTSGRYFGKSDIDSEYKDIQTENRPFYPTRILIKCPNVLNSFSQRQDKESSLANFLKNKLNLNGHEQVFPVYRPHSTEKVPCLRMSDLTGSDFSRCDFTDSCFDNCNFTDCVMLNTTLTKAKMRSSTFCRTFIFCSNLEGVDASLSEFGETNILYSHVDMMDMRGMHMFGNLSWHGSNVEKTKKFKYEEINGNDILAEGAWPPPNLLHGDTHESTSSNGITSITEHLGNIDLNKNFSVRSDVQAGQYEGKRTPPNCWHSDPVGPSTSRETTVHQDVILSPSERYPMEKMKFYETRV